MKKIWLAILSAAALIIVAPGLASAVGTSSAPHRGYVSPAVASSGHELVRVHPAHPFHTHPMQLQRHPFRGYTAFNTVGSGNWSGFAAYGDHFRYVSTTYTIPSLNCTASPDGSYDSEWAGLDGYTNWTVEQIGTFAVCSGGSPSYYAFYEMYPEASVDYTGVSPGDSISVSVYYDHSSAQWKLHLSDNTAGGGIDEALPCPPGRHCRNTNAEVISEALSNSSGILPLADYGTVGFTQIAITDTSAHKYNIFSPYWKNDKIYEVDSGGMIMQAPGTLEGSESGKGGGYANQAFTDTALSSN